MSTDVEGVAIVGAACRTPGATDAAGLWQLVLMGTDALSRAHNNVGGPSTGRVEAYGALQDIAGFDRQFFGYSPREATEIDPQQRLLLECAVEALEDGAVRVHGVDYEIGTYVSVGYSTYLLRSWQGESTTAAGLAAMLGSDGHYAATRLAYKLGLTGPAVSVGSACSSSLLAVHLAAQAIALGECDVAVAGGMDVEVPQPSGYLYQEGGILSPRGVCRPFDRDADGTVFGSGGGLVVLARRSLADELGLPVRAMLRGSAANNDGSEKASFTAPRTSRQAAVVRQALDVAELDPSAVSYVECHGTGTQLGDRAELSSLGAVFGTESGLLVGSVKANIGHLRVGSGVVGLIKACEVVSRGVVPACANLETPTPALADVGASAPLVPITLPSTRPAIAGVSSFGFGGTNVHVVIEAPSAPAIPIARRDPACGPLVLKVSSATPDSCLDTAASLGRHIGRHPDVDLSSVARTLDRGRDDRAYRFAVVGGSHAEVERTLLADATSTSSRVEGWSSEEPDDVVLLLAGQASDLIASAQPLLDWDSAFTASLEQTWEIVRRHRPDLGDLRSELPAAVGGERRDLSADHALHTGVAIALGDALRARSVRPTVVAGYSLGEYAAAVLTDAFDREDCLALVLARGRQLELDGSGDMLVASATVAELESLLPTGCTVAAVLSHRQVVLAADVGTARDVVARLTEHGIRFRPLDIGIGYHSPLLAGVADQLRDVVAGITARPRPDELVLCAGDRDVLAGDYWLEHLTSPVDFTLVARRITQCRSPFVVDTTPGGALGRALNATVPELGATYHPLLGVVPEDARTAFAHCLAQRWARGAEVDTATYAEDAPLVRLPSRSFDRQPYLTTETESSSAASEDRSAGGKLSRDVDVGDWVYYPSWRLRRRPIVGDDASTGRWLVLAPSEGLGAEVVGALEALGADVVTIRERGRDVTGSGLELAAGDELALQAVLDGLVIEDARPFTRIVHLWCVDEADDPQSLDGRTKLVDDELERGFYTLLYLIRYLGTKQGAHPVQLDLIARGIHPLADSDIVPERALLEGPALVIPQELPFVAARTIDVSSLRPGAGGGAEIVRELLAPPIDKAVTLADGARWVRSYEREPVPAVDDQRLPLRLREGGVYLITGGIGGIGLTLAEYLARRCRARLVLTGLGGFPDREAWDTVLADDTTDPLVAERIRRIREIEELGAEVLALQCDAGDHAQTAALIEEVDRRFGGLHGVVHAAGIFETQRAFKGIEETSRDDCHRRLWPKVNGTLVLAECLRGRSLDFLLMQSSLSSHLGGLGFYSYTAGNAYMDAFSERFRTADLPWMSVNWDGWIFRERGDEPVREATISPSFASPSFGVVAEIAVRPSEGAEVFERLIDLTEPRQVLVSTADFSRRMAMWVDARGRTTRATNGTLAGQFAADDQVGEAPATEVERRIAEIWRRVLGHESITLGDNFFALGGDSLLGVEVVYQIGVDFGVVASVITMFDDPTVAGLSAHVESLLAESGLPLPDLVENGGAS